MSEDHNLMVGKLLSGMRWSVTLRFGAQLISWVITLIVVRYISPGEYGINAMLEAPLEILALFSVLGIDMALVQAKVIKDQDLKSAFGMLLLLNGLLFLTYFFGAEQLATYYNEPRLGDIGKVLSVIFLTAPFRAIPNALMDRALDFKLKATVELVATIVASVSTLVMAYNGAGVWALVFGLIINTILRAILFTIARPWFVWPSFDFSNAYLLVRFGGVVSLNTMAIILGDKVMVLVGGPHLGKEAIGFLAIGMQFAFMPMSKLMPILQQILFPAFSRLQEQPAQASWYFKRALGLITIVLFPMLLGLASVAEDFILVVFGERWLPAAPLMALLALLMPMRLISNLYEPVLNGLGRPGLVLFTTVIRLLLMLIGSFIGIAWGVIGLGLAWGLAAFISMVLIVTMARDILNLRWRDLARQLAPALVGSLAMMLAIYILKSQLQLPPKTMLTAEVVGGALVYLAVLHLVCPHCLKDLVRIALKRN